MVQNVKERPQERQRIRTIEQAVQQVGKPVFHSILIIVVAFLPVFMLSGQEGKLFHPLAWTKTLVMVASMLLTLTLVPVLMVLLMRGRMRPEASNPVSRFWAKLYEPVLRLCLEWKRTVLILGILSLGASGFLLTRLGTEFMPPLDEGCLLFMPVALPDASHAEMKRLLDIQDRIIAATPEVANVLGKAGRISSATDNAPLSMVETIILLKPRSEWRKGMTKQDIINELNRKLQIPGVTNGWTQPIINRINMLSTGIRTDVGVKVFGSNLDTLNRLSQEISADLKGIPGVVDLYPEQLTGGKYLDLTIRKSVLGRYGLTADAVNQVIESAIGGMNVSEMIQGRERYGISVRLAQNDRNNLEKLRQLTLQTPYGPIPLEAVADLKFKNGPSMINSENAMLRGTVLFDVRGRDLGSTVQQAMRRLNDSLKLPSGYYLQWSGQWENQIHAAKTLKVILPLVLMLILLILYLTFRDLKDALNTLLCIPFAMVGGVLMVYVWGQNLSVAVAVGFIALFGIAVETGVVMMIYLNEAMHRMVEQHGTQVSVSVLRTYVMDGAVKRLRPKLMTVSVALLGLVPTLWSTGRGIELMRPIALPMIGGVLSSAASILLVMPVLFELLKERELRKYGELQLRADGLL